MNIAAGSENASVDDEVRNYFKKATSLRIHFTVLEAYASRPLGKELFVWALENEVHEEARWVEAASRAFLDLRGWDRMLEEVETLDFSDDRHAMAWLSLANAQRGKSSKAWRDAISSMLATLVERRDETSRYTRFIALATVHSTRWPGKPRAIMDAVRSFYGDRGTNVTRMAVKVSGYLGDDEATAGLEQIASDRSRDVMVRAEAMRVLGRMAPVQDQATAEFMYELGRENIYLAVAAYEAFADMAMPDWIDRLSQKYGRYDREDPHKKRALKALDRLNQRSE